MNTKKFDFYSRIGRLEELIKADIDLNSQVLKHQAWITSRENVDDV